MSPCLRGGRSRSSLALLAGLLLVLAGCGAARAPRSEAFGAAQRAAGLEYWFAARTQPRPLRFHQLKVDLQDAGIEVVASVADDPDADGPATATLIPPAQHAEQTKPLAMVNANPWQSTPDANGRRTTNWRPGLPVEVLGLVASRGVVRAPPLPAHCAFWLDRGGRAHIGQPSDLAEVREGVAGFAQLVGDGRVLPDAGGPIHPRTALGLDASQRYLYLVVVDGRQPGYSEGLANRELADYLLEIGCRDAMNLDGGGSSIMMLAQPDGARRTVNDPSTKENGVSVARPIPVALCVRRKASRQDEPPAGNLGPVRAPPG